MGGCGFESFMGVIYQTGRTTRCCGIRMVMMGMSPRTSGLALLQTSHCQTSPVWTLIRQRKTKVGGWGTSSRALL